LAAVWSNKKLVPKVGGTTSSVGEGVRGREGGGLNRQKGQIAADAVKRKEKKVRDTTVC